MSKFLKSVEEGFTNNDDLQSITNVKEIDAEAFHISYLDQFKTLSLSFYNDYPLQNSQTSTNVTNKSGSSNRDLNSQITSYEKTKQIIGKIFRNATQKSSKVATIINKPKTPAPQPKTSLNFKSFYINNRFPKFQAPAPAKTFIPPKDVSLPLNPTLTSSHASFLSQKKKNEPKIFPNKCVNNVRISLKDSDPKPLLKKLNSSFTTRSLSKTSKKSELNNSSTSNLKPGNNHIQKKDDAKKQIVVNEKKPNEKNRNNSKSPNCNQKFKKSLKK